MHTLIGGGGDLQSPQGLHIDHHRKRLLLADPKLKKVLAYPLYASGDSLEAGASIELADDVEARWVVADGRGNVFFSDEAKNKILKIPPNGGKPEVIYTGGANKVSGPGGVVTDNFNLFWTNKVNGKSSGSLVSGPMVPNSSQPVTVLSKNIAKSYGVCMSMDDIFYTADVANVYGMKRTGGKPTRIANSLGNPRGCAWDGDSTIYVADRGNNGIFYFPAPQAAAQLEEIRVSKAVDLDDAFGVAIFVSGCRRVVSQVFLSLLCLCVLV